MESISWRAIDRMILEAIAYCLVHRRCIYGRLEGEACKSVQQRHRNVVPN